MGAFLHPLPLVLLCYSTGCRRARTLAVHGDTSRDALFNVEIIIDSAMMQAFEGRRRRCLQVISARLHWAVHQQLVAMATREESGFDCHNGQHCAMSSTVLRSTWSRDLLV